MWRGGKMQSWPVQIYWSLWIRYLALDHEQLKNKDLVGGQPLHKVHPALRLCASRLVMLELIGLNGALSYVISLIRSLEFLEVRGQVVNSS